MIFLASDTHGMQHISKVLDFFKDKDYLTKEDFLIILGDVLVTWNGLNEEVVEILRNLPVTVCFIDGNHEDFSVLNDYNIDKWNGGKVHFITEDIIHLMRGQVYNIEGLKIFTFGGAHSYNKKELTPGLSWWSEELPNSEEYKEAWKNLKKHGYEVDYILTHTAPYEVVGELGFGCYDEEYEQVRQFQEIADKVNFNDWYFGHFHMDEDIENFHCIMDNVIELN